MIVIVTRSRIFKDFLRVRSIIPESNEGIFVVAPMLALFMDFTGGHVIADADGMKIMHAYDKASRAIDISEVHMPGLPCPAADATLEQLCAAEFSVRCYVIADVTGVAVPEEFVNKDRPQSVDVAATIAGLSSAISDLTDGAGSAEEIEERTGLPFSRCIEIATLAAACRNMDTGGRL